jgi:hypothetical protein
LPPYGLSFPGIPNGRWSLCYGTLIQGEVQGLRESKGAAAMLFGFEAAGAERRTGRGDQRLVFAIERGDDLGAAGFVAGGGGTEKVRGERMSPGGPS